MRGKGLSSHLETSNIVLLAWIEDEEDREKMRL